MKLVKELRALSEGVESTVTVLSNACALIFYSVEDLNWAGFYILNNGVLQLGPFQGRPACVAIGLGKGVCGTAAREERTVLVENVHEFPGHIACDCASNSEIVVPIYKNGALWGVLDIDSPLIGRFGREEKELFEAFAVAIGEYI